MLLIIAEILLSTLLRTFKFSPAVENIEWRLGVVTTPTVKIGDQDKFALPLKLSYVSDN